MPQLRRPFPILGYVMMSWQVLWQELRVPIFLLVMMFVGGATGYHFFYPQEPWYRLFYMTAITLSTVGFGDVLGTEHNPWAAWYTMALTLMGMGIVVYSVSSVTAFFVGGNLTQVIQFAIRKRKIDHMQDHYIVCGAGSTGVHVIQEMHVCKVPFLVIEQDEARLQELREEFPDLIYLVGDATHELLLEEAQIERAKGLIAALHTDKDNLFLTLTARLLNPRLRIVSKAIELGITRRLQTAGADYIVSPNYIGGMRMAAQVLRPNVVSFLDRMLRGQEQSMRVGEVLVPVDSPCVGKTLGELDVYAHTGLNVMAYLDPSQADYLYNPGPDTQLEAEAVLLVVSTPE